MRIPVTLIILDTDTPLYNRSATSAADSYRVSIRISRSADQVYGPPSGYVALCG